MRLFLALLALSMTLATFSSCGSEDDEQDTDEAGEGEGEGEGEGDEGLLTDSHAGWRQPTCSTCHLGDNHNEGMMPSECAECHGSNGALDKGSHSDQESCFSSLCHAEEDITETHAPASDFPEPGSCGVCH